MNDTNMYDFGGGIYPFSPEAVVVDIMSAQELNEEYKIPNKVIQHDLTTPIKLEKKPHVRIACALRGMIMYPTQLKLNLKQVVDNIDNALVSGGIVTLFDWPYLLKKVSEELLRRGYTIISETEEVNWVEDDEYDKPMSDEDRLGPEGRDDWVMQLQKS